MYRKTLAGINKIEFLPAKELVLYPKKIIKWGESTSAIGDWQLLELVELASCHTTSEQTDAGLVFTTKLAGVLYDEDDGVLQSRLQSFYHVYRISDVYKNQYLVGTDKKPFPEIYFAPANEANPSGLRAVNIEISWVSLLPPIPLVQL
jgi:hypothetical protein